MPAHLLATTCMNRTAWTQERATWKARTCIARTQLHVREFREIAKGLSNTFHQNTNAGSIGARQSEDPSLMEAPASAFTWEFQTPNLSIRSRQLPSGCLRRPGPTPKLLGFFRSLKGSNGKHKSEESFQISGHMQLRFRADLLETVRPIIAQD